MRQNKYLQLIKRDRVIGEENFLVTQFQQPRLPLPPALMMSESGSFAHITLTQRLKRDHHWNFTTFFADIVCYFPATFAALRTLKSEIVAGFHPGQAEALSREDPQWLTNGQWGVSQFFSGI